MAISGWLVIALSVGLVLGSGVSQWFPGGVWGAIAGGTFGAVVGGSALTVLVDARSPRVDPESVVAALVGAAGALVTLIVAGYADTVEAKRPPPRPRRS